MIGKYQSFQTHANKYIGTVLYGCIAVKCFCSCHFPHLHLGLFFGLRGPIQRRLQDGNLLLRLSEEMLGLVSLFASESR